MSVADAEAFSLIASVVVGETPSADFAHPALARLARALRDPVAGPRDIAVLLRHALLVETARRGTDSEPGLPTPKFPGLGEQTLTSVGLATGADGRWRAVQWQPTWLPTTDSPSLSPDAVGARAERRRFGETDLGPEADPFLSQLGLGRYRSVGQRAAVRAALLTPSGQTTVIDLPTGEGKSLVFQVIDQVGFASGDTDQDAESGITLVVVPTIALAYDHEARCRRTPGERLAYVGSGEDAHRAAILERLTTQQNGLVFAAPEAVCRSLRQPLRGAAKAGRLKAIVIDEAHLVDAWGTGFRTDFQTLSGLRSELVALAPTGAEPRTLLLSATLTPETLDTLKTLFSLPGELRSVSASQVRPEPEYWVARASDEETRIARVEEALSRLPRPVILYVTEVKDAVAWEQRLRRAGYGRLAAFHGRTPDAVRQATLALWARGELDIVVATSAFGLGIDYPHVRSVVHACVPETFDRFYQEVGRGGRDGCASLSVVVPTPRDLKTAEGLNRERVITVMRGIERWRAMFNHDDTQHLGGMCFRLRLDVAPSEDVDDIDLVGERSLQWNARVITLLARAGVLRLSAGEPVDPSETGAYEVVEILDPGHLDPGVWQRQVEPVRQTIAKSRTRNLDLLKRHLTGAECPGELVLDLYGPERVGMACSSCARCRTKPSQAHQPSLRREPAPPWPLPQLAPALTNLLGADGRLAVTFNPDSSGLADRRRAATALQRLWQAGVRAFLMVGDPPELFGRAVEDFASRAVFVAHAESTATGRLPTGPLAVLLGARASFARPAGPTLHPRIIILPRNQADPERPGERVLDRWTGPALTLEELSSRIAG